jgi:RimJ/RimL family protein N-acetyltransferase
VRCICSDFSADLETSRTTKSGLSLFLRPVKTNDLPLLEEFFGSLSDRSMYQRFASARRNMPDQRLRELLDVDYHQDMLILAVIGGKEEVAVGLGQYCLDPETRLAELALVVRDDYQSLGVGCEIQRHLTEIAKRKGVLGFTAEVMQINHKALALLSKMGFVAVSQDDESSEMELIFAQEKEGSRQNGSPQKIP